MNPEPNLRKAVIDIGTNTINLLIARPEGRGFKTEHFARIPAKLGQGGMRNGLLTDEAIHRGMHAIGEHEETCAEWGVEPEDIKVTATSAVRSANNRQEFIDCILDEFGLEIEVIDGDREAELIWKGVKLTGLIDDEPGLIMDIGGGSTEFILAGKEGVHWMKSYPLGVTRIMENYKISDPFTQEDEARMRYDIEGELHELWKEAKAYPVTQLIGASGSFNSIDLMLAHGDVESLPDIRHELSIDRYVALSARLKSQGQKSRSSIPGLIADRVDTMPYAALLIDLVIEKLPIQKLWRSTYALKEGLMSEMME